MNAIRLLLIILLGLPMMPASAVPPVTRAAGAWASSEALAPIPLTIPYRTLVRYPGRPFLMQLAAEGKIRMTIEPETMPPADAFRIVDTLKSRIEGLLREWSRPGVRGRAAIPADLESRLQEMRLSAVRLARDPVEWTSFTPGTTKPLQARLTVQMKQMLEAFRIADEARLDAIDRARLGLLQMIFQNQLAAAAFFAATRPQNARASLRGALQTLGLLSLAHYDRDAHQRFQRDIAALTFMARAQALRQAIRAEWEESGPFEFWETRRVRRGDAWEKRPQRVRYGSKARFVRGQLRALVSEFRGALAVFDHLVNIGRIPYVLELEASRQRFTESVERLETILAWASRGQEPARLNLAGDLRRALREFRAAGASYDSTGAFDPPALRRALFWTRTASRRLEAVRYPQLLEILETLGRRMDQLRRSDDLEEFRAPLRAAA